MEGAVNGPASSEERCPRTDFTASYDMNRRTRAGAAQTTALTDEFADRFGVFGPPEHCIEALRRLTDLGLDRLVIIGTSLGADRREAARASERFTNEVLPALQESRRARSANSVRQDRGEDPVGEVVGEREPVEAWCHTNAGPVSAMSSTSAVGREVAPVDRRRGSRLADVGALAPMTDRSNSAARSGWRRRSRHERDEHAGRRRPAAGRAAAAACCVRSARRSPVSGSWSSSTRSHRTASTTSSALLE